jgi:deoxyribodipyrimidine photolyase-like uncharacterized protein
MPRQKILRLVLGDQLNERHSWFKKVNPDVTYVLMEIRQETDYVNSFYWAFFNRQRPRLHKNPRVAMMYRTWDRMQAKEKKQVLKQADGYRKDVNRL